MLKEQHFRAAAEAAVQAVAALDRFEGRPAHNWNDLRAAEQIQEWQLVESNYHQLKNTGNLELSDNPREELKGMVIAEVLCILDPTLREVQPEGPRSSKFPDAPHVALSSPVPDQTSPVSSDPNDKPPVPDGQAPIPETSPVGKTETPIK